MTVLVMENDRIKNDFISFIRNAANLFNINIEILNEDGIKINSTMNSSDMHVNRPSFSILHDDEDANYGQI